MSITVHDGKGHTIYEPSPKGAEYASASLYTMAIVALFALGFRIHWLHTLMAAMLTALLAGVPFWIIGDEL